MLLVALLATLCHAAPADGAVTQVTAPMGQVVVLDGASCLAGLAGEPRLEWRQVCEPDLVEGLGSLEAPTDFAEAYGTRLRGYLHPPQDGLYTFWIASDDASELWLSDGEEAGGKRLLAKVQGWTAPRGWDQGEGQKSAPVRLRGGQAYYIEALHKEGGGGDHLAVAWSGPGMAREVVPGSCLSPIAAGPGGGRGSVTREVWLNLPGGEMEDLTASARFPGGCEVRLEDGDRAQARFTAQSAGTYLFELTASTAAETRKARVSVLVTDVLRNGDFEAGAEGGPEGWRLPEPRPGLEWRWETGEGMGGSRCLSLSVTDPAAAVTADASQELQLAPYAPYLLRGYLRCEGLKGGERYPASVGVGSMWMADNGPKTGTGDLDWTPFEVDFANDPSGRAEVHCRLSAMAREGRGAVYFDNLTLVPNPEVETFTAEHFVLNLYADQVGIAGREVVQRIMRDVDRVCAAYTELTGWTPGGEKQGAWAPDKWDIGALGWSGNPTLWSGDRKWMGENWGREAYMPEVFLHELGHNWDNERWTFDGHFCEFKMAYALEVCDLAIAEDGYTRGAATRNRWEVRSADLRRQGRCNELVQTYRNLEIRDRVGWEPFKRLYRYFLALPADQVPADNWGKFKLWHDKLSEFSGFDAWSVYQPGEIEFVQAYYRPKVDQATLRSPAETPEGTGTLALAQARWVSAEVGWEAPRATIEGSDTRWHPDSIYAHAPSRYEYDLGGVWGRLSGSCALARGNPGSVMFVALGDGKELLRTELVRDSTERPFEVDVTGVQRLVLVVEDGGNGRNCDHGTWFDPVLSR